MSIYERDPEARPDSDYEPAALVHLMPGNRGRSLDARRTPVTITAIRPDTGTFTLRIDAFEDAGAIWEEVFENLHHFQFELGSMRADDCDQQVYAEAIARLDRPWRIPARPEDRERTRMAIAAERDRAGAWLREHSRFLAGRGTLPDPETREGDPRLHDDLEAYLADRDLADMERDFAEQFVSNPYSGERVKGHRVVLAELGLVDFEDKILRDPATFEGRWSRERRRAHILARFGFLGALFGALGQETVVLYRGMSTDRPLEPPRNNTFVSTSFNRAVALSHFDAAEPGATRILQSGAIPVGRLFMTHLETRAMNRQYREAEAVLVYDPESLLF
jgi:hypothetical protein